jgi:prepilin peptidase CpaA
MMFPAAPCVYTATALACAGVAAVFDLKTRRIPNLLTGPSILIGLLLHLVLGGWAQLGLAAAAALIAGGIFVVFYLAGGMGAGDVKLMTAVACMAGFQSMPELLIATVVIGAIFALVMALVRGRLKETFQNIGALFVHHRIEGLRPHAQINLKNTQTLRLPYAIAIASGCLVTFLTAMPPR